MRLRPSSWNTASNVPPVPPPHRFRHPRSSRTAMVPVLRIVLSGIVAACVIGASGCGGVTYQREAVAGAVQDLLTHEGLQASVRLLEHTLAVKVDYPGALRQTDDQISLGADFDKVLQLVIPQVHRVLGNHELKHERPAGLLCAVDR